MSATPWQLSEAQSQTCKSGLVAACVPLCLTAQGHTPYTHPTPIPRAKEHIQNNRKQEILLKSKLHGKSKLEYKLFNESQDS